MQALRATTLAARTEGVAVEVSVREGEAVRAGQVLARLEAADLQERVNEQAALVANESGAGVTRIGLDYDLPIANAILTTENMEQAIARQTEKGADAARVAVEMAMLVNQLAIPEDELDNLLNGEQ